MKDYTEKIRVALPLDMEAMKKVVTIPELLVEIDYANSRLKGRSALIYMTNTNLQSIVLDTTNVNQEDIFALVHDYVTHKSTLVLPQVVTTVLNLLFDYKGIELPALEQEWMDEMAVFPRSEVNAYKKDEQRNQAVLKLIELLDNLPLYAVTCNVGFRKLYGNPKDIFETINDVDYTGFTFINLFKHPLFLEYYVAPISSKQVYFTQQFEEYMYNGRSLFAHFVDAPIMAVMDCFISGKIVLETLDEAHKEMRALEKTVNDALV